MVDSRQPTNTTCRTLEFLQTLFSNCLAAVLEVSYSAYKRRCRIETIPDFEKLRRTDATPDIDNSRANQIAYLLKSSNVITAATSNPLVIALQQSPIRFVTLLDDSQRRPDKLRYVQSLRRRAYAKLRTI